MTNVTPSCPRCYNDLTEQQKSRFQEREKQVQLAKSRGETHIGIQSRKTAEQNRSLKQSEKQRQRIMTADAKALIEE